MPTTGIWDTESTTFDACKYCHKFLQVSNEWLAILALCEPSHWIWHSYFVPVARLCYDRGEQTPAAPPIRWRLVGQARSTANRNVCFGSFLHLFHTETMDKIRLIHSGEFWTKRSSLQRDQNGGDHINKMSATSFRKALFGYQNLANGVRLVLLIDITAQVHIP